jgi:5-methylcytosine-specific restriction protein A
MAAGLYRYWCLHNAKLRKEVISMTNETKTSFVNRVLGLSLKSVQGKYSFCNDSKKQILFGLNPPNIDVILSPSWSHNSYVHSMKHIHKIVNDGYELLIFTVYTKLNSKGKTQAAGFEPVVQKRKLLIGDDNKYRVVPLEFDENTDGGKGRPAPRKDQTISRIIRDTKISKKIKAVYNNKCQVCATRLEIPGGYYSEGAHIIPLGFDCHGPDLESNVLCLCPNHHVLMDSFAFTFDLSGKLIGLDGWLTVDPSHKISEASILWHNSIYSTKN